MPQFYDGTKLLSMKDLDKKEPEIILCTTNRSAGKTTFFSRWLVKRFLKYGEKFGLLYRFNYELDNVADSFFKDIRELFFPEYNMTGKVRQKGIYYDLYLIHNKAPDLPIHCGYAMALNKADQIKKKSHLMSDVARILLDEFQSESNTYCPNEITKFQSIHTSLARGKGKQVRFLPTILLGNCVSILNPYFVQLGISSRLHENTKFLRGHGFVLEHGFVVTAANAQLESSFNRAFAGSKYVAYSTQNVYLNDNKAFVQKPEGAGKYLMTLKYHEKHFAVWEFASLGFLYCDQRVDMTFPKKLAVTTDDHNINYVLLKRYQLTLDALRFLFDKGCFRFSDLESKECILTALSYV